MGKKKRAAEEEARRARVSAIRRNASLLGHAKMTPEQRSERARIAGKASAAARAARRAAAGEPEPRQRATHPSARALEPFYVELDVRFPDREWAHEERRREAELLLRKRMAEDALRAAKK